MALDVYGVVEYSYAEWKVKTSSVTLSKLFPECRPPNLTTSRPLYKANPHCRSHNISTNIQSKSTLYISSKQS
jgi:hypothetical protein